MGSPIVSATLPNGMVITRGDRILVQHGSDIRTAFVDEIGESGGHIVVSAAVIMGSYHSTTGGQPAMEFIGKGIAVKHHSISRNVAQGVRFAHMDEGQAGYDALLADMTGVAQSAPLPEPQEGVTTPPHPVPGLDPDHPANPPAEDYHPADADRDGVITKSEKKEYKRKMREGEGE